MALLELKNLKTFFATKRGTVKAVNGVSYSLDAGKVLGVVGEVRFRQERLGHEHSPSARRQRLY